MGHISMVKRDDRRYSPRRQVYRYDGGLQSLITSIEILRRYAGRGRRIIQISMRKDSEALSSKEV